MANKKIQEEDDFEENKSPTKEKSDYVGAMRNNPWIVSTVVLGLVLIVVLIMNGGFGVTGNVVSSANAGQNLVDFINSRGDVSANVISVEKDGSLYKAMVDIDGQQTPVYVTLDGKYAIAQPIPLTANAQPSDTQPNTQQPSVNVPKSDKPKVELFVMSYCPYGTQIEKGIIPVIEALGDKIDFELKFVNYAMHPTQGEVEENTREYCIQKEQNDKFLDYMTCFLDKGDSPGCLTKTKIDQNKLNACYKKTDTQFSITKNLEDEASWSGGRFPKFNINAEENTKYGVQGSPTLVINGEQADSGRDSASLLKTICNAFNDAPEECSETWSSTSPSPGFGYTASASGSNTAAQCL